MKLVKSESVFRRESLEYWKDELIECSSSEKLDEDDDESFIVQLGENESQNSTEESEIEKKHLINELLTKEKELVDLISSSDHDPSTSIKLRSEIRSIENEFTKFGLTQTKIEEFCNLKKEFIAVDNFVFSNDKKVFTLLLEVQKEIKFRWPKSIINSKKATWSFKSKNDFLYSVLNVHRNNDDEKKYEKMLFVDGKLVERKSDLYVKSVGRYYGMFYSWEEYSKYTGEKEAIKVEKYTYHLIHYKENSLKIKILYLKKIDGIEPAKIKLEEKKSWKRNIRWLVTLWNQELLTFDDEKTEQNLFKEYNKFAINE